MPVWQASPNGWACAPPLPTIHILMLKAPHCQWLPQDLLPLHAAKAHQRITLLFRGNGCLLQAVHHMGARMRGMRGHKEKPAAFCNHTTTSHYNYNTAYNLPPQAYNTHDPLLTAICRHTWPPLYLCCMRCGIQIRKKKKKRKKMLYIEQQDMFLHAKATAWAKPSQGQALVDSFDLAWDLRKPKPLQAKRGRNITNDGCNLGEDVSKASEGGVMINASLSWFEKDAKKLLEWGHFKGRSRWLERRGHEPWPEWGWWQLVWCYWHRALQCHGPIYVILSTNHCLIYAETYEHLWH